MNKPLSTKVHFKQDCPLLTDEHRPLAEAFNLILEALEHTDQIANWIEVYLDPEASGQPVQPGRVARKGLRTRLEYLRDQLTRDTYRVGVAGRFQVGKTSSINNVLQHQLLSEGKTGASCTSVVTIVELSPAPRQPAFCVQYFSREELRRRFEEIVTRSEFVTCPVRKLPEAGEAQVAAEKVRHWAEKQVANEHKADAKFLVAILADYASGWKSLETELPEIPCQDEKHLEECLSRIVTYGAEEIPANKVVVPYPLLIKHVKVLIHLPDLNPTLELVDLPGLGTVRTYDTALTSGYVRELQGLLLFVEPGRQNANELRELVQSFRHTHQEMAGRLWAVISQMDKADVEQMKGPIFETLLKSLPAISIEPHQVRFLSNYCELREDNEPKKYPTRSLKGNPARLAEGLKLPFQGGEIQPPESMRESGSPHHVFLPAFRHYMQDGGFAAFEEVIRTEIADSVRNATCREVHSLTNSLIDDLANCLKNAQEGGLDEHNCDLASDWSFVFLEIEARLAPGKMREELSRIASPLFEGLWNILLPSIQAGTVDLAREAERKSGEEDQWVSLHQNITERMGRHCEQQIPTMIGAYTAQVIELLKQAALQREPLRKDKGQTGNGQLEVPRGFDPLALFRLQVEREVLNQTFFKTDLDLLKTPAPIVNPLDPRKRSEITTEQYLVVMRRKLEALCYRIISKMRVLVIRECQRIQRQLSMRSRVRQGPDVIDAEKLATALKTLDKCRQRLQQLHSDDFVAVPE